MTDQPLIIRTFDEARSDALRTLYAAAFPGEDLFPLVDALLAEGQPAVLSLAAFVGDDLAGHVLFTRGSVAGHHGQVALLGPLGVVPSRQKQGIGKALIGDGLERLARDGVRQVHVLGDPAYYGRIGFAAHAGVAPPFPLPGHWAPAWQMRTLRDAAPATGTLSLPDPWMDPALWRE